MPPLSASYCPRAPPAPVRDETPVRPSSRYDETRDPRIKIKNATAPSIDLAPPLPTIEYQDEVVSDSPNPLLLTEETPDPSPQSPPSSSTSRSTISSQSSSTAKAGGVKSQSSQDGFYLGIRALSISPVLDVLEENTVVQSNTDTDRGLHHQPGQSKYEPLPDKLQRAQKEILYLRRELQISRNLLETESANLRSVTIDSRRFHADLESSRATYRNLYDNNRRLYWANVAVGAEKEHLQEEARQLGEARRQPEKEKMDVKMAKLEIDQENSDLAMSLDDSAAARQTLEKSRDDAIRRLEVEEQAKVKLEKENSDLQQALAEEMQVREKEMCGIQEGNVALRKSLDESHSERQKLESALAIAKQVYEAERETRLDLVKDKLRHNDKMLALERDKLAVEKSLQTSLDESISERQSLQASLDSALHKLEVEQQTKQTLEDRNIDLQKDRDILEKDREASEKAKRDIEQSDTELRKLLDELHVQRQRLETAFASAHRMYQTEVEIKLDLEKQNQKNSDEICALREDKLALGESLRSSLDESTAKRQKLQASLDDARQQVVAEHQLRESELKEQQEHHAVEVLAVQNSSLETERSLRESLDESVSQRQKLQTTLDDATRRYETDLQSVKTQLEKQKQKNEDAWLAFEQDKLAIERSLRQSLDESNSEIRKLDLERHRLETALQEVRGSNILEVQSKLDFARQKSELERSLEESMVERQNLQRAYEDWVHQHGVDLRSKLEVEKQRTELEQGKETMEKQRSKLEEEKIQLQKTLEDSRSQQMGMQRAMDESTQQLEKEMQSKVALETTISELNAGLESKERQLGSADMRNAELVAEVASLRDQHGTHAATSSQLVTENEALSVGNTTLSSKVHQLEGQVTDIQGRNVRLSAQILQLNTQKTQLEAKVIDLETAVRAGYTRDHRQSKASSELQQQKAGLEERLIELEGVNGQLRQGALGSHEVNTALRGQIESMRKTTAEALKARTQLQDEASGLRVQVDEFVPRQAQLLLEGTRELQVAKEQHESAALAAALAFHNQIGQLQTERESLRSTLCEKDLEIGVFKIRLFTLEQSLQKTKADAEEDKRVWRGKEDVAQDKQQRIELLGSEVKDLKSRMEALAADRSKLEESLQETTSTAAKDRSAAEADLAKQLAFAEVEKRRVHGILRAENGSLRQSANLANSQIKALQTQLATLQTELVYTNRRRLEFDGRLDTASNTVANISVDFHDKIETAKQQVGRFEKTLRETRRQWLSACQTQLSQAAAHNLFLSTMDGDRKTELNRIEHDLETALASNEVKETQLRSMESELRLVESKLESATKHRVRLEKQLEEERSRGDASELRHRQVLSKLVLDEERERRSKKNQQAELAKATEDSHRQQLASIRKAHEDERAKWDIDRAIDIASLADEQQISLDLRSDLVDTNATIVILRGQLEEQSDAVNNLTSQVVELDEVAMYGETAASQQLKTAKAIQLRQFEELASIRSCWIAARERASNAHRKLQALMLVYGWMERQGLAHKRALEQRAKNTSITFGRMFDVLTPLLCWTARVAQEKKQELDDSIRRSMIAAAGRTHRMGLVQQRLLFVEKERSRILEDLHYQRHRFLDFIKVVEKERDAARAERQQLAVALQSSLDRRTGSDRKRKKEDNVTDDRKRAKMCGRATGFAQYAAGGMALKMSTIGLSQRSDALRNDGLYVAISDDE